MFRRKDNGLWVEVIREYNGKRVSPPKYIYGRTQAEVKKKINEYRGKQEHECLFQNVASEWWEEHEPTLAYNTTRSYKPAKERAAQAFEDIDIKTITPVMVDREIKQFAQTHKDKTVRTQLMIYNLIFRFAVVNGYADYNPAREVKVPRGLEKNKRTAPTPQDIQKVKECTDLPFGMFAYWLLYTGCRRGELLALTWEDVDLNNKTITINKSVYHKNGRPYIKKPKTSAGIRTVPLLNKLREKIKPGKGLIFHNDKGEIYLDHHAANMWRRYQESSGVSCTPHQLRHAYATMLFENDIPEKDAQELLGHAQLSTTMDIYTDIREERKRRVFDKMLNVDIE